MLCGRNSPSCRVGDVYSAFNCGTNVAIAVIITNYVDIIRIIFLLFFAVICCQLTVPLLLYAVSSRCLFCYMLSAHGASSVICCQLTVPLLLYAVSSRCLFCYILSAHGASSVICCQLTVPHLWLGHLYT